MTTAPLSKPRQQELIPEKQIFQYFFIPDRLASFNEIRNSCKTAKIIHTKDGKSFPIDNYRALKKKHTKTCAQEAMVAGLQPMEYAHFRFHYIEPAETVDPDNLVAKKKFILDGLVEAGVFTNDRWPQVKGFIDKWDVDPAGVGVHVYMRGKPAIKQKNKKSRTISDPAPF